MIRRRLLARWVISQFELRVDPSGRSIPPSSCVVLDGACTAKLRRGKSVVAIQSRLTRNRTKRTSAMELHVTGGSRLGPAALSVALIADIQPGPTEIPAVTVNDRTALQPLRRIYLGNSLPKTRQTGKYINGPSRRSLVPDVSSQVSDFVVINGRSQVNTNYACSRSANHGSGARIPQDPLTA